MYADIFLENAPFCLHKVCGESVLHLYVQGNIINYHMNEVIFVAKVVTKTASMYIRIDPEVKSDVETLGTLENVKKILLLISTLFIALLVLSACDEMMGQTNIIQASDTLVTEVFENLPPFNQLTIGGSFIVTFVASDEFSVTLTLSDNLLPYFEVEVENNILSVGTVSGIGVSHSRNTPAHRAYVKAPYLTGLTLRGSSSVENWETIETETFTITASGSTNITLDFQTDVLTAITSGSGTLNFSGNTRMLTLQNSGSSHINAADLYTQNIVITASGSTRAYLNAAQTLSATLSGSSRIYYAGSPVITQQTSGSAHVLPMP